MHDGGQALASRANHWPLSLATIPYFKEQARERRTIRHYHVVVGLQHNHYEYFWNQGEFQRQTRHFNGNLNAHT